VTDDPLAILSAVSLLALAALHLAVSTGLAVPLVRERVGPGLGLGVWLLFTVVGVVAAALGVFLLVDEGALGSVSPGWVIGGAVVAAVPPLIVLVRWRERGLLVTAGRRVREAEERASARGREADAISRLSSTLTKTASGDEVAEHLFDELGALVGVEALMLAAVDEEERRVNGFASRGVDGEWWRSVELDLDDSSGAIVTVARERSPYAVYDVTSALNVNRRLANAVGAKSAAFVPLVSDERVTGVLVLATRAEHRLFSPADMELVQGLANEAALALGRARSKEALGEALERERRVAEIGRRVRSELDLDAVLDVATKETARALSSERCFVRLGAPGEPMPIRTEWHAPGVAPIGEASERLPVSNLAARSRRTIAIADVASAPELEDASLGGRSALLEIGTMAVLAVPILVFDRLIGVFGLHRSVPGRWTSGDISFAEAVARELGLAVNTANLLGENARRLEQRVALLDAAEVLTRDLRFESVIQRLVEEVVALTRADAADCWIFEPDRKLLRCRAVLGVPEWNVGRQIPPEGTIGRAAETGQTVLTHDFAETEEPPASPPYQVFQDVMAAPITWLGEARGVLGVCSRERGRFGESEVELLEAFARFASLALHNAESFEKGERQSQVERGFYRVAETLGSTLSLDETLDALAQAACEALGAAAALVLEPLAGDRLVLAGSHELPRALRPPLEEGLPRSALPLPGAQRHILASSALAEDERFAEAVRELFAAEGFGSLLCAPVAGTRGDTSLVLVLFKGERSFADGDLALLDHLGDAAQGALERSELFDNERRGRTVSQRLAEIGTALAKNLDPATVLSEVARQAASLLECESAVIRLLEGDELVVDTAEGPATAGLVGRRSSSAVGVSGIVAQSGSPLAVEDARDNGRLANGDPLLEAEMVASVAVPVSAPGGGLHGVLAVYSRTPRAWRDDEVQALVTLGAAASAAAANASLYQRVAEEKERSDTILANIADGIVAVDREDRIVLWNVMAEGITGVPASEALGRRVPEVLQRELAGEGPEALGERPVTILRGGREVLLSLSEAVMLDPGGEVAGRVFAFRDVSSQRVVEQMRSDFVATVSHELRAPLTSIYGFAETLLRGDVDFSEVERTTFLGYVSSESERLIRIVDDLLNVARLEAGSLGLTLERTDAAEAVQETVARLTEHDIRRHFVVDVGTAPLFVRADREKLGQILLNLVDNAVKFSPEGSTITISARRRTSTAEISVSDEGIGIAGSERQRIFSKFFRSDQVAQSGVQGVGLGLFLVRGLVAAMGGRIWVDSQEGQGTSFTFELLLAAGEHVEVPEREAETAPS
jgi:PAS domain S-box-containing protein